MIESNGYNEYATDIGYYSNDGYWVNVYYMGTIAPKEKDKSEDKFNYQKMNDKYGSKDR